MSAGDGYTVYKKAITHNLGYKPIVRAFAYIVAYSIVGLREVPINYYERVWVEGIGWAIEGRQIWYEHTDDNTITFFGEQDVQIKVTLYLEPRKDAWYE